MKAIPQSSSTKSQNQSPLYGTSPSAQSQERVLEQMYACFNLPSRVERSKCTEYWSNQFEKL